MIIHSAQFSPSTNKLNCSSVTQHSQRGGREEEEKEGGQRRGVRADPRVDIRRFVSRRCSGYSSGEECKFSLLLDVVESEVWGGGLVTILHTCQATRNIRQDCQHDNNQVGPWSSGAVEKSPP